MSKGKLIIKLDSGEELAAKNIIIQDINNKPVIIHGDEIDIIGWEYDRMFADTIVIKVDQKS